MGVFQRLGQLISGGAEIRQGPQELEDFFTEVAHSRRSSVVGDMALRVIPVYSAVSWIADSIAVLPLNIFKHFGDVRRKTPYPAWMLKPDPRVSFYDWIHQLAVSVLLRGNAYGIVFKNRDGSIFRVEWIHPDRVSVDESYETSAWPVYHVGGLSETSIEQGGRILHVRGFTVPGSVKGLSPVALFKSQFETAMWAAEYGHDWFENSAVPTGILKNVVATLSPEDMAEAKAAFKKATAKREPVTLDKNWSWEQVSLTPEEAQFLATIKASATLIAAIFRVDPEEIGGEAASSLTYSTRESNQTKYNIRTLLPWVRRFETAFDSLLLPDEHSRFDLDSMARPTLIERTRANSEALRTGQIFHDELRADENRPPATAEQIAFWQENYQTQKSASESISEATSIAITEGQG